jgi:soluble lytic murein transglycosylase-like protein
VKYDPEVTAAVTQAQHNYGVAIDSALVHAVIQRETSHGPYPLNGTLEPNGQRSWGPMQVEASTAQAHGIADPSSLSIPSVGIRIGTFELARLLKMFPGDTPRAIAAYNAGPGNAARRSNGTFFNQPYVDAVIAFWQRFKGGAAAAAPLLGLVALVAAIFLLAGPRRGGRALAH